jgi:hypothetical protein
MKWLCCQLGAHEHYAIPRALFRMGMLGYLLTDAWPASSLFGMIAERSEVKDRAGGDIVGFANCLPIGKIG